MKFLSPVVIFSLTTFLIFGCGGGNSDTTKNDSLRFTTPDKTTVTEGSTNVLKVKTINQDNITYKIVGGADADKFKIDSQTGILSFINAPDFENPADTDHNNQYIVIIEAVDKNGRNKVQTLIVTVTNDEKDDGPEFTSEKQTSLIENKQLNFIVVADGASKYAVSGGADAKLFQIDEKNGKLTFKDFRPDYDFPSDANRDNMYNVIIEAMDDQNYSSEQNFTISITDDPNDLVPSKIIWKTGQNDGSAEGLAFGTERNFKVEKIINADGEEQRVIVAGDRMWEDSAHSANVTMDFDSAVGYCVGLSYSGYNDWRAPSRHELAEMLNYGKLDKDNMFDDIFKYRQGGNYWTSQEKKSSGGGSALAWSISFDTGGVYDISKDIQLHIRCIRGKEITDHSDFSVENNIVIDNKTGIMWQNSEFIGGKSWQEAIEHCKALVFQGYDDWRLPNVNELRTVMPVDNDEILFSFLPSALDEGAMDSGHSWSTTEADKTHAYYNLNDWDQVTDRDSLIIMYEEYPKTDNTNLMLNRCIRGGHL